MGSEVDYNLKMIWEEVDRYLNLPVGGRKIICPYFTNHAGLNFIAAMKGAGLGREQRVAVMKIYNNEKADWGRWRGKGTAREIAEATEEIAAMEGVDLAGADEKGIREFMVLHGLGVDCSGFAYNVLAGAGINLDEILDFADPLRRGRFKAGAFTFAGGASEEVAESEVRGTDLILIKDRTGKYTHVALVLERAGELVICQSTGTVEPAGVVVSKKFSGFDPELGTPWEKLRRDGRLEYRRLRGLT